LLGQEQSPTDTPAPPQGKVLYQRHTEPIPEDAPEQIAPPSLQTRVPTPAPGISSSDGTSQQGDEAKQLATAVPDTARSAVRLAAYDLDLHLNFTTAATIFHARVTLRNEGRTALAKLPLQISSSLAWQSARLLAADGTSTKLDFEQHRLDTDTDHTGAATEAVFTLPTPLAPDATVVLDLFYGGSLSVNADRLARLGAPEAQATASDWDGFGKPGDAVSGIRGFGNVLWYPVAAPAAFLGDANHLYQSVAQSRLQQQAASFHMRLTVEYTGTRPDAAFFCGHREPLLPLLPNAATEAEAALTPSDTTAFATAEWTLPALGLRTPSLLIAVPAATETAGHLVQIVTERPDTVSPYAAAARLVQPVLSAWLGASPLEELTLLDLGTTNASPYEDGAMLALPLRAGDANRIAPVMVHALTHAWFHAPELWMNEGLATFMEQIWVERTAGRDVALAQGEDSQRALALYESTEPATDAGVSTSAQPERLPLTACADPACYRTKGAAVWQMLRILAGEQALQQTLAALRVAKSQDTATFEALLEKTSGKDLAWFFDDWVLHDRGLPELSIVNIAPRSVAPHSSNLPGSGPAITPAEERVRAEGGWLTAIEVSNEGTAAADVPVTLSSGSFTSTDRLRIAAHSRATLRMLTPAKPEEVTVNDGTTPEIGTSLHRRTITERAQ
jgi:hypothetical protein